MKDLAALWEFQKADMEVDKFEASLRGTPTYKQLSKLHVFLEEQRKTIARVTDEVQQRAKVVKAAKSQFELAEKRYKEGLEKYEKIDKTDLNEVVRFRKYFEKISTLVTNERKEFAAVTRELAEADDQLEAMRKKIGPARKEYQEYKEKYEQECAAAKDELDGLKKTAAALEKKVDAELLGEYKTVKRSTRMPLVKVKGNQCGGCMMQLSAVLARKLKESDDIIECENCGRILYQES